MAVFVETIKLEDQVSGPATKAAGSVKGLADTVTGTTVNMKGLGAGAHAASGSLSETATSAAAMEGEMAALTGGLSIAVAAIGAVVVGLGALIAKGVAFAIEASEAKAASIALWDAMGGGVIAGEEVDAMLDGLRDSTGLAKGSLEKMTTEFLKMGINGKEALEGLTISAASAEAIVKGGADAFTYMFRQIDAAAESGQKLTIPFKKLNNQLAGMGLNVEDVASVMGVTGAVLTKQLADGTVNAKAFGNALQDAVTKKGAGPMAKLANSAGNLKKMLEESIGDMFEDIDIGPFMAAVKSLFSILGEGADSGKALKAGIGGFFKEVFGLLTKVVPMVKHFMLDLIIYGLKAYIALKPIAKAIQEFFASAEGASTLTTVLSAAWTALQAIGAVIGAVVVAFGALVAIGIAVSVAFWTLLDTITTFRQAALEALMGWAGSALQAATDFVNGLVQGIANGASLVTNAVSNLASSASGAFKSALGIASPSKVMMGMGANVGEGVAMGMEATAPDVHGAASGLASATVAGASAPAAAPAAAASGGGAQITVMVQIDGAGKSAEAITEEMVSSVFERYALAAGV